VFNNARTCRKLLQSCSNALECLVGGLGSCHRRLDLACGIQEIKQSVHWLCVDSMESCKSFNNGLSIVDYLYCNLWSDVIPAIPICILPSQRTWNAVVNPLALKEPNLTVRSFALPSIFFKHPVLELASWIHLIKESWCMSLCHNAYLPGTPGQRQQEIWVCR